MSKGKVLLGLSGGVDSSVAALILKNEGYKVDALFMRNWEDDDGSPYCSIKEDFLDAVFVANQLKIDLEEENFSKVSVLFGSNKSVLAMFLTFLLTLIRSLLTLTLSNAVLAI